MVPIWFLWRGSTHKQLFLRKPLQTHTHTLTQGRRPTKHSAMTAPHRCIQHSSNSLLVRSHQRLFLEAVKLAEQTERELFSRCTNSSSINAHSSIIDAHTALQSMHTALQSMQLQWCQHMLFSAVVTPGTTNLVYGSHREDSRGDWSPAGPRFLYSAVPSGLSSPDLLNR